MMTSSDSASQRVGRDESAGAIDRHKAADELEELIDE